MKLVSAAAVGRILTPVLCILVASPGLARAEDPAPAPTLDLELNAMQPSDKGCRLTFLVKNDLASDLEKAAYEIVLFDKAGQVSRLVVLDFQNLPAGKTKVRQFDFAGTDCANVGRILVNDSTECKGAGVDPKACIDKLQTTTKAEVEFGL